MNDISETGPTKGKGVLGRTLGNLRNVWRGIAGAGYDAQAASLRPDLPESDRDRLREQMRACLISQGGEVSARARAAALGHAYLALDRTGRERFLKVLADDFDIDQMSVDEAIDALQAADGREARRKAEQGLRKALEAPRIRLLTQFNALPEGVKFLVDLRADLLSVIAGNREYDGLKALDGDLRSLLATWFDVDFLELRRITWGSAPAALLEKLIAYEAVHAIESWDDLKNRLDDLDRRCFAYFHPRMPDEPLIFVEVALSDGMADNVQDLLDEDAPVHDPAAADTAIFYSISNAQKGLAGISFGNFLIKRVADSLFSEFKGLKHFATLSPAPGFRGWLDWVLEHEPDPVLPAEESLLRAAGNGEQSPKEILKTLLDRPGWYGEDEVAEALKKPLMRLCARYLVVERRADGRARDPVAHFHLTNGARLERLNWLADRSRRGLDQSAGMMVNYLYDLARVEANNEAYVSGGQAVTSSAFRGLLKG